MLLGRPLSMADDDEHVTSGLNETVWHVSAQGAVLIHGQSVFRWSTCSFLHVDVARTSQAGMQRAWKFSLGPIPTPSD
jgi:membrane associated rhomboid family serine protease